MALATFNKRLCFSSKYVQDSSRGIAAFKLTSKGMGVEIMSRELFVLVTCCSEYWGEVGGRNARHLVACGHKDMGIVAGDKREGFLGEDVPTGAISTNTCTASNA